MTDKCRWGRSFQVTHRGRFYHYRDDIPCGGKDCLDRRKGERRKVLQCVWTAMDLRDMSGHYDTKCGEAHTLMEGTPKENRMRFCCYCGHELIESP